MCSTALAALGSRSRYQRKRFGTDGTVRTMPAGVEAAGENVVEQVRGGLRHPSGIAGWTQSASLAREGHEEIVVALGTSGAGEIVGQNAAFEMASKLLFHVGWHPLAVPVLLPCAFNRQSQAHGLALDNVG
jgi:hypothetical protein